MHARYGDSSVIVAEGAGGPTLPCASRLAAWATVGERLVTWSEPGLRLWRLNPSL